MTTKDEALSVVDTLKLALEALKQIAAYRPLTFAECSDAEAVMRIAENAIPYLQEALAEQPAQQEPVFAIRLLTNQCFALIQERDELKKQVWLYEKNGVTCQTYRHKVDASCSECNVHEVYTSPPASKPWVGLKNNELQPICDEYRILFGSWVEDFASAIEAKLREKNCG